MAQVKVRCPRVTSRILLHRLKKIFEGKQNTNNPQRSEMAFVSTALRGETGS